jgi:hypothetical protein
VYPWTSGGFGAAYANPGTALGVANSVAFSNKSR